MTWGKSLSVKRENQKARPSDPYSQTYGEQT